MTDGEGGVWLLERWCYERLVASGAGPRSSSLVWAVAFVGLCWLLLWVPYRRRWFVRA